MNTDQSLLGNTYRECLGYGKLTHKTESNRCPWITERSFSNVECQEIRIKYIFKKIKEQQKIFGGDGRFKAQITMMVSQVYTHFQTHQVIYIKCV